MSLPSASLASVTTVAGFGTYLQRESRTSSTPSPVSALIVMTGMMSPLWIPVARPCANSSSVKASPSKNFSMSSSSAAATASSRASLSSRVTHALPNLSWIAAMTSSSSTLSLSILLMMKNVGELNSLTRSQAFSVPTWIPDEASTMMIAVAPVERAALASPAKSKNPGVSIKLSFVPLYSTGTSVWLMVYPFSISIFS